MHDIFLMTGLGLVVASVFFVDIYLQHRSLRPLTTGWTRVVFCLGAALAALAIGDDGLEYAEDFRRWEKYNWEQYSNGLPNLGDEFFVVLWGVGIVGAALLIAALAVPKAYQPRWIGLFGGLTLACVYPLGVWLGEYPVGTADTGAVEWMVLITVAALFSFAVILGLAALRAIDLALGRTRQLSGKPIARAIGVLLAVIAVVTGVSAVTAGDFNNLCLDNFLFVIGVIGVTTTLVAMWQALPWLEQRVRGGNVLKLKLLVLALYGSSIGISLYMFLLAQTDYC